MVMSKGLLVVIGVVILIVAGPTWLLSLIWLATPFRPCKWWCHDILGWHEPDPKEKEHEFDGCNTHATCRFCGKKIMQDSQGNWF